jgi:hypothetical protein
MRKISSYDGLPSSLLCPKWYHGRRKMHHRTARHRTLRLLRKHNSQSYASVFQGRKHFGVLVLDGIWIGYGWDTGALVMIAYNRSGYTSDMGYETIDNTIHTNRK